MARRRWRSELDELRRDRRSGASELESLAASVLEGAISDSVPGDLASYRRWLMSTGRQVVGAQPSMANIFRLVNDMLWYAQDARSGAELRTWALHYLDERHERAEQAMAATLRQAAEHLSPYRNIMTYSRSATVMRALQHMAEGRTSFRVFCSESRPGLEGQQLAFELASAGIKVTLGIDMALIGWLDDADVVVVGADTVSTAGIVNKIGTRQLLWAARELDIPRVVVCTSIKFLPESYVATQGMREGDPEEIMPGTENVTVRNPYFESSPLDHVSFLITEEGRLEIPALVERLEAIRIYPGLMGRQE